MFFFFLIYTLSVLIVTFRHTAMSDEIPYWKPSVKSVCDSNFHAQIKTKLISATCIRKSQ